MNNTAVCISVLWDVVPHAACCLLLTTKSSLHDCHCHVDLKICEPDKQAKLDAASATPNDPLKTQQWALNAININGAWKSVRPWCQFATAWLLRLGQTAARRKNA